MSILVITGHHDHLTGIDKSLALERKIESRKRNFSLDLENLIFSISLSTLDFREWQQKILFPFTKIQARVRPPPIQAMPVFWEFLDRYPLPNLGCSEPALRSFCTVSQWNQPHDPKTSKIIPHHVDSSDLNRPAAPRPLSLTSLEPPSSTGIGPDCLTGDLRQQQRRLLKIFR